MELKPDTSQLKDGHGQTDDNYKTDCMLLFIDGQGEQFNLTQENKDVNYIYLTCNGKYNKMYNCKKMIRNVTHIQVTKIYLHITT